MKIHHVAGYSRKYRIVIQTVVYVDDEQNSEILREMTKEFNVQVSRTKIVYSKKHSFPIRNKFVNS